eukprot:TRINITY_DN34236_c0_g1_i1.p1 TRINITY_DN34236_c0_g1~~TRINITY_DN34236_c0_g1_i1.p1  ORF type:complete len:350 (+),score=62.18 TRINITY_DN34236_c0_g1_i1:47-1051(+)
MRAAEFTYLVIGLVIGALLNSAMKQGDDHAKPAAQSVQQAPNTVPVPVPVPVPMPVPVPLPVPVPNAHVAASPSDSHDVPTPYVVPKLGTDTRDCNRGPRSKLVIPASEVKAITDWHTYKDLCCYPDSRPDMQRDAMKAWTNPAGKEHYALLSWLSNQFGAQGGAMFAELGSKEGLSAMAMAVHPMVTVFAFDVVSVATHVGSVMSSRNGGKRVTPMDVQKAAPNIHFVAGNLADPASAYWRKLILGSRVLLLDTNHFPESKPFEYEVLKYLDENNYCGILLMDDLNLTGEMKRFWKYIQEKYGDRAIDVTRIGHGSGTGLLDFCGNTVVNWDI